MKCSLELWPVLVWWTIVFTMIIPFTTLFWVAFLILLALTPLFEIVNTVRGKRTPISRWRWDAAIEAYEPDEPITTQATQHWSTVDVETPLGVPRLMFTISCGSACTHTHRGGRGRRVLTPLIRPRTLVHWMLIVIGARCLQSGGLPDSGHQASSSGGKRQGEALLVIPPSGQSDRQSHCPTTLSPYYVIKVVSPAGLVGIDDHIWAGSLAPMQDSLLSFQRQRPASQQRREQAAADSRRGLRRRRLGARNCVRLPVLAWAPRVPLSALWAALTYDISLYHCREVEAECACCSC